MDFLLKNRTYGIREKIRKHPDEDITINENGFILYYHSTPGDPRDGKYGFKNDVYFRNLVYAVNDKGEVIYNEPTKVGDIKEYVKEQLEAGSEIGTYIKGSQVTAFKVSETVEGKTVLADGTIEREYWKAEPGDWVAIGPGGEQWPITKKMFNSLYDVPRFRDTTKPSAYTPKAIARFCIKINQDITFPDPWEQGKEFTLKAGGYLNVSNPKRIYGIGKSEFEKTHTIANEKLIDKSKKELKNIRSEINRDLEMSL